MAGGLDLIPLFGGSRPWTSAEWTDSDDRVRGGRSQSYLDILSDGAVFRGNLDIETLGGAGFASQRTSGDKSHWNLAETAGVELVVNAANSDDKKYTLIIKDELLPSNPENGREQSTTSWEFDFHPSQHSDTSLEQSSGHVTVFIPWTKLQPTYRGRPSSPAKPLCTSQIKRFSIMMRSFFGSQHGDFHLELRSITARRSSTQSTSTVSDSRDEMDSINSLNKPEAELGRRQQPSLWSRLLGCRRL